jgi:general secretion pathway protein C
MVSRIAAFVIWAAVAASAVFWGLRLWPAPIAAPVHATVVSAASAFNGDLRRVLGPDGPAPRLSMVEAPQVEGDERFRLIGVVAPRARGASEQGLALIATDGKPAKAYRVGTSVDGELVLLSVHARGASLGPRGQPAQVDLTLPALPPPSTGPLPGSASVTPGFPAPAALPPRLPRQPPQLMPSPAPVPPDGNDNEPPPDPANRPGYVPPINAGRPPT